VAININEIFYALQQVLETHKTKAQALGKAVLVCYGEEHDNEHDHIIAECIMVALKHHKANTLFLEITEGWARVYSETENVTETSDSLIIYEDSPFDKSQLLLYRKLACAGKWGYTVFPLETAHDGGSESYTTNRDHAFHENIRRVMFEEGHDTAIALCITGMMHVPLLYEGLKEDFYVVCLAGARFVHVCRELMAFAPPASSVQAPEGSALFREDDLEEAQALQTYMRQIAIALRSMTGNLHVLYIVSPNDVYNPVAQHSYTGGQSTISSSFLITVRDNGVRMRPHVMSAASVETLCKLSTKRSIVTSDAEALLLQPPITYTPRFTSFVQRNQPPQQVVVTRNLQLALKDPSNKHSKCLSV
jgi:hypothetical protein